MDADVKKHYAECDYCQRFKPYTMPNGEKKNALVYVDYFTKEFGASPLIDTTAALKL